MDKIGEEAGRRGRRGGGGVGKRERETGRGGREAVREE